MYRSFVLSVLLSLSLSTILFAADYNNDQDQAQYASAGVDHGGAVGAAALGAGGRHRDLRDTPSTDCVRPVLISYSVLATLAILGLIGGWVGEHYSRDECACPLLNITNATNATWPATGDAAPGCNQPDTMEQLCALCEEFWNNMTVQPQ